MAKKHRIIVETREEYRIRIIAEAKTHAQEFGMSFLVFINGLADRHCTDVNDAKRQASFEAGFHGRENVRIKCIKV